ncbi:MAG: sigma-70 family RNA polymerase sigma factor [Clostridia bacterium]|nr:sigma-70 family RNA polymerase sigma factor [Clostridia bacterium]
MNREQTDAWFSHEVESMSDTLFRVAFAILRNYADCEDAVQNTIMKAYRNLNTLREPAYFRTWTVRILKNECFAALKKQRTVVPLAEQPEGAYEMEVPDLDLNRAFDTLSPEERLTVTLYYYEGYKTAEIAKLTDVSDSTVRNRLARARAALKEKLTKRSF